MNSVEFAEKIIRSKLLPWQKEMLISMEQSKRPLYLCMRKDNARTELLRACHELCGILYDDKGETK